MDFVSGTVGLFGLVYSYCSLSCLQNRLEAATQGLAVECSICPPPVPATVKTVHPIPDQQASCSRQPPKVSLNRQKAAVSEPTVQGQKTCKLAAATSQRQPRHNINHRRQVAKRDPKIHSTKLKVAKRQPVTQSGFACTRSNSCRPGKITRNAFLNFVREVRPTRCGQKQTEVVKEAACRWRMMNCQEKTRFSRANVTNKKGRK